VKLDKKILKIVSIIFAVFMLFDISISCIAANRQTERRNNISPESKLDLFLDKYEYMDKIFANKREVCK